MFPQINLRRGENYSLESNYTFHTSLFNEASQKFRNYRDISHRIICIYSFISKHFQRSQYQQTFNTINEQHGNNT